MSCPTDLDEVERNVLLGLRLIHRANLILAGQPVPAELDKLRKDHQGRDSVTHFAYHLLLRPVPAAIRRALPFLHEKREEITTVEFRNRAPKGKRVRLPGRLRIDNASNARWFQGGSVFRALDERTISKCLSNKALEPHWPDMAKFIAKAKRAFIRFRNSGRDHFKPKVDEIKQLIVGMVEEYDTFWARRAEDPNDPKQIVADIVRHARPASGVPVEELYARIQEIEPAADDSLIDTALIELGPEVEGRIKKVTRRIPGTNGRKVKCWVLNRKRGSDDDQWVAFDSIVPRYIANKGQLSKLAGKHPAWHRTATDEDRARLKRPLIRLVFNERLIHRWADQDA